MNLKKLEEVKGDSNSVEQSSSKVKISQTNLQKTAKIIEISEIEAIKQEIYNILKNNFDVASPFFQDFTAQIEKLQQKGDIFDENFVFPWYIVIIFLEMLEENQILLKIENFYKGPEGFFLNISNNFSKYFTIISGLIDKPAISQSFKSKILKKIAYDITILKQKTNKENKSVIELILLKEDYKYLDILVKEAKTLENCKACDLQEMENEIILEINHKIVLSKTMNIFKIANKNQENQANNFKQLKQEIIEFCILRKMNEITKILFHKFPNEVLSVNIIVLALENDCYEYLKEGSSVNKIKKILIENTIMHKLIGFLLIPQRFLDCIFFLFAIKDFPLPRETQKLLHETFKDLVFDNEKNALFLYNVNPLLIFVMLCVIFDKLSKHCFHYQHSFKKYSLLMSKIAGEIVKKYDNFYNLKKITYEIYYPARVPLIKLIFDDKDLFGGLFENDRLAKITRFQLNSFYNFDLNVFACSTSFQYANFNRLLISQKAKKNENMRKSSLKTKKHDTVQMNLEIFYNFAESVKKTLSHDEVKVGGFEIFNYISKLSLEEVNNKSNHCYQYKIYLKSIAYRALFDAIFFFALFVYLHINTNQYSTIRTKVAGLNQDYANYMNSITNWSSYNLTAFKTNENITADCINELSTLLSDSNGVYNQTLLEYFTPPCVNFHQYQVDLENTRSDLMYLCYFLIAICCNVFIRKFYQIYVKKSFNLLLYDQLDIICMCFVIVLVCLDAVYHEKTFDYPEQMLTNINLMSVFIALLLFTFWLQMFQYVKLIQSFGYIIKTLELLIKETYVFLWVFFLFIAAFSSINLILFGSFYSTFSGYFIGIVNLFGYALGSFQFMDGYSDYYVVISAIINIIYVLFTNVILINLLIALLSSVYQKVSENSDLEYSHIIHELREEKYFDYLYGSMMIYPRVVNIFLLPVHLLTFCFKSQNFNKFIASIGFFFVSLPCYIAAFLGAHAIFIPIAWLNIFVLIFLGKYHDHLISKHVTLWSKITHLFIWLILGLPYLLYVLFFCDFVLFIMNMFHASKKSKDSPITILEYSSLCRTVKQLKYSDNFIETDVFLEKFIKIAEAMEAVNSCDYKNSKLFLTARTNFLFNEVQDQEKCLFGLEEIQKKNNVSFFKFRKIIDIIQSFSLDGKLDLVAIENVIRNLKIQIKQNRPKRHKEINKLSVVNYKDMLDILNNNIEDFKSNKKQD